MSDDSDVGSSIEPTTYDEKDYSFGRDALLFSPSFLDLQNRMPLLCNARNIQDRADRREFGSGKQQDPSATHGSERFNWSLSVGQSEGAGIGMAYFLGPVAIYQSGANVRVYNSGGEVNKIQGSGQVFLGALGWGGMAVPVSSSVNLTLEYSASSATRLSSTTSYSVLAMSPFGSLQLQISKESFSLSVSGGLPVQAALGLFLGISRDLTLVESTESLLRQP
jgi:hypothetical protein